MTCKECQELLWDEFSLTDVQKQQIQAHIQQCPNCAKEAIFISEIRDTLHTLPEIELPENYHTELMTKIKSESNNVLPFRKQKQQRNWKNFGMVAAAVVLVAAIGGAQGLQQMREQQQEIVQIQSDTAQRSMQQSEEISQEQITEYIQPKEVIVNSENTQNIQTTQSENDQSKSTYSNDIQSDTTTAPQIQNITNDTSSIENINDTQQSVAQEYALENVSTTQAQEQHQTPMLRGVTASASMIEVTVSDTQKAKQKFETFVKQKEWTYIDTQTIELPKNQEQELYTFLKELGMISSHVANTSTAVNDTLDMEVTSTDTENEVTASENDTEKIQRMIVFTTE